MKMTSRLVWISFSMVALLLPYRFSHACGYGPQWEEYRILFFNPQLSGNKSLSPFYFTQNLYYEFNADKQGNDVGRNCKEWQNYLGKDVLLEDIEAALYKGNSDDFLTPLLDNNLTSAFPGNGFIKKINDPAFQAALDYLTFAKRIEFVHSAAQDPWGEETNLLDRKQQLKLLAEEAQSKSITADNPFLKNRYAYQKVLCLQYADRWKESIDAFDANFSLNDPSILMPWALQHKAIGLMKMGNKPEANYWLSRVFDLCDSKKIRVTELFSTDLVEETLPLAKNNKERATILAIPEIRFPGRSLPKIKEIAMLDPGCPHLPLLLTREINKLEDWLLTQKITGIESSFPPYELYAEPDAQQKIEHWQKVNYEKDKKYLQELIDWLQNKPGLWPDKNFYHLALGHLYFMDDRYMEAMNLFNRITHNAPTQILAQKEIEKILLTPLTSDLNDPTVQNKLANMMRTLWRHKEHLERPTLQLSRLNLYLCDAFFHKGNIPFAGLLYNKALFTAKENDYFSDYYSNIAFFDNHADYEDIAALLALQSKKQLGVFEKYLMEPTFNDQFLQENQSEWEYDNFYFYIKENQIHQSPMPEKEKLLDLQGTLAFRQNDLAKALEAFEKLPVDYWQNHSYFSDYLNKDIFLNPGQFPFEKSQNIAFNKADIIRRMIALQQEAESDPSKSAVNYYLLGNAHYNTSYYGNAWMMTSYGKSSSDWHQQPAKSPTDITPSPRGKITDSYYNLTTAKAYYQKALDAASDKELKAKALYLLADCDYKIDLQIWEQQYWISSGEVPAPKHPNQFRQWKKQYAATETYQERMAHCPELKDFLGEF